MASITNVHLLRRGLAFEDNVQGKKRYEAEYEVLTSALITDQRRIKQDPRLPRRGSLYAFDSDAVCVDVQGSIDEQTGTRWVVRAEFSNDPVELSEIPEHNTQPLERNPLDRAPKISWKTVRGKKIATIGLRKDLSTRQWGNAPVPIQNAAGLPYNPPPTIDDSMWVGTFQRNYLRLPRNVLAFKDAVNMDVFLFDGITIYQRWAKLGSIQVSPVQRENGFVFRSLTLELQFKPVFGRAAFPRQGAPREGGWDLVLLNRGLLHRDAAGNLVRAGDDDGAPTPEPGFLSPEGRKGTAADSTDEEYRAYPERPFQSLIYGGL